MITPSDRIRKCRAHADQCRALADLATHERVRNEFLRVAAQWDQLAREIGEIEQMRKFVAVAEKA